MYKSNYLNNLLEDVKRRYGNEKEFVSAVEEFFDSMDFLVDKDPRIEQFLSLKELSKWGYLGLMIVEKSE